MISTNQLLKKMLLASVLLSTSLGFSALSVIKQSQTNENIQSQHQIPAKSALNKRHLVTKNQKDLVC